MISVNDLKRSCTIQLTITLALVSLLIAAAAPRVAGAQTTTCADTVVLQRGQTLATIAARNFGTQDAVADLTEATNALAEVDASYTTIHDPNTVEAGWKICIPATRGATGNSGSNNGGNNGSNQRLTATPRRSMATGAAGADNGFANVGFANLGSGNVTLEHNSALLESTLAARMGAARMGTARVEGEGVHPLSIEYLRRQRYSASPLTIEASLPGGSNYTQYVVSYHSEGLKLYAAMTVPDGAKPERGWPVVIFNHGYVDPEFYSPTTRYTEYVDAIASSGYIVLRPDLRGHGNSAGVALGAYGDPGYVIDVLNALASIKEYADADPHRIGMWGHSMGGYITARAMVVSDDIRAGVIWSGVVAPYEQLISAWGAQYSTIAEGELPVPAVLTDDHGAPAENPDFWNTLSANAYVRNISGPVQLHHGTADASVPVAFSEAYYTDMISAGQVAEYYLYEGDDHNISASFDAAMRRSLDFLDAHVKQFNSSLVQQQTSNSAN